MTEIAYLTKENLYKDAIGWTFITCKLLFVSIFGYTKSQAYYGRFWYEAALLIPSADHPISIKNYRTK